MLTNADRDAFIELVVLSGALRFGEFTTKSGRATPYFVNFGRITTGALLRAWAALYATVIEERFGRDVDLLFGPAYKGIPLASSISTVLAERWGRDVAFAYDRKEVKDHGEGGAIVGPELTDGLRVVIVEDVTTAGTSIRRAIPLLREVADVDVRGLVISLDRCERGAGDDAATTELAREFGIEVASLMTTPQLVEALEGREIGGRVILDADGANRIRAHLTEYGPRAG